MSSHHHSNLRADDGTPLEVKEGIILDQDGNPAYSGQESGPTGQVRVFRGGWVVSILLGILIPLLFVMGFAVVAVLAGVFLVVWLIRSFLRALR